MTSDGDYPIELTPPDISAYRDGNTGVDYVTTFDSGKPGPHVMLSAVVHGNELCGAVVLDWLHREQTRPRQGKLTLAFTNVAAYLNFSPRQPSLSRFVEEDFNRVWNVATLEGPRQSTEVARARAVRPVLDQVDYLLDVHSMQHANVPLTLCGPHAKGRELARQIAYPAHVVSDEGHAAGRRMRDYGGFGDPHSRKNALLVECGQHWAANSAAVAKQAALRFLRHFEMLDPDFLAEHLSNGPTEPVRVIEVTDPVTINSDDFRFVEDYTGMEVIPRAGTTIAEENGRPILTPYDDCVLIMPSRRMQPGQTAVRLGRYV